MWKCECGEFNNDELEFCVRCDRVRLSTPSAELNQRKQLTAKDMFRRIQDFILFDIAFCAMVALYCLFVEDIWKLLPGQQFVEIPVPEPSKQLSPLLPSSYFRFFSSSTSCECSTARPSVPRETAFSFRKSTRC